MGNSKHQPESSNFTINNTVVGVEGVLKGSGTVVLINNEIKILTNLHLVQNLPQATVTLPSLKLKDGMIYKTSFTAIKEFPHYENSLDSIYDLAVLSVPLGDKNLNSVLFQLAQKSVHFLSSNSLNEYQFEFLNWKYVKEGSIFWVSENQYKSTIALPPWEPKEAEDCYISGFYKKILIAPVYGRPGMSGGAYFQNGRLAGILTKVDLSGAPYSYIIPIEEISKFISSSFFGHSGSKKSDAADLVKNYTSKSNIIHSPSIELVLQNGTKLVSSARSGRTGIAGGGEGGSGGDSLKYFWKLQAQLKNDERTQFEITNPFEAGNRSLKIDEKEVAYFIRKSGQIQNATLPLYLWLVRNRSPFKIIYVSEESENTLLLKRTRDITSVRFARTYEINQTNQFDLLSTGYGFLIKDGAQILFPWDRQIDDFEKHGFAPKYHSVFPTVPNESGYYLGHPLSARNNKTHFIDVLFNHNKNNSQTNIRVKNNFAEIAIHEVERKSGESKTIKLNRISKGGAPSYIFTSVDQNYRAISVFDQDNLDKMERMFIETPTHMFEFLGYEPGRTSWR